MASHGQTPRRALTSTRPQRGLYRLFTAERWPRRESSGGVRVPRRPPSVSCVTGCTYRSNSGENRRLGRPERDDHGIATAKVLAGRSHVVRRDRKRGHGQVQEMSSVAHQHMEQPGALISIGRLRSGPGELVDLMHVQEAGEWRGARRNLRPSSLLPPPSVSLSRPHFALPSSAATRHRREEHR